MITASLVIYNKPKEILFQTIDTFLSQKLEKYLVVINNNPTNTQLMYDIIERYRNNKEVTIINSMCNRGYGAGNNIGFIVGQEYLKLNNKKSDYHIILNPDLIITDGCIAKMLEYIDKNPEIGLLVPKICNIDGTIQELNKEHPTVFDLFVRRFLPKFIANSHFFVKRHAYYTRQSFGYDKIVEVPFASGCFMMFRTKVYLELNGFDEDYFLYMEDADISLRAGKISKIMFYPDAIVKHHWERATHTNYKMMLIAIKSAIIYFKKHGLRLY